MSRRLHCHLRTGLDYDSIDSPSKDILESLPEVHHDPAQRAAKRQRIEAISSSYLRGERPLILSAHLRGPFDGWESPWGNKAKDNAQALENVNRPTRTGALATDKILSLSRSNPRESNTGLKTARKRKGDTSLAKDIDKGLAQVRLTLEDAGYGNKQQTNEQQGGVVAPTLSLIEEQSIATEYFSAPAQRTPDDISPWLPPPERVPADVSATATLHQPVDTQGEEQHATSISLALTKPRAPNTEWRSSASASMVISSPVKAPNTATRSSPPVQCAHRRNYMQPVRQTSECNSPDFEPMRPAHQSPDTLHPSIQSSQTVENTNPTGNEQNGPLATRPDTREARMSIGGPAVLQFEETDPVVVEGHRSAKRLAWQAVKQASHEPGKPGTPHFREDIQRFAAQCAQNAPAPLATEPPECGSTRRPSKENTLPHQINRNFVASPALVSSTGFVYRKTEKIKTKEREKPRLANFNSSPGVARNDHKALNEVQLASVPIRDSHKATNPYILGEEQAHRSDVYDVMVNDTAAAENHMVEEERDRQRASRLSFDYSTQAAFTLAQMEFQGGTSPSIPSDTPHTAWNSQDNTPQPTRRERSPVVTPFHAFNVELDRRHPLPSESVLRGPSMSTQDLFTAASPFAFSTVKKRSTRAQRSSLRFAVLSNQGDDQTNHENGAKSPTPSAERIALRERNSKMSFRGTSVNGSEKGSQDSLLQLQTPRTLPLLDFHTSLDNIGPNADLEFTDRFLRNLDGIT